MQILFVVCWFLTICENNTVIILITDHLGHYNHDMTFSYRFIRFHLLQRQELICVFQAFKQRVKRGAAAAMYSMCCVFYFK